VRYGVSFLLGGLAIFLGSRFSHHWTLKLPFITFYTVLIMMSAALGGLGPGLLCTAECALAADYYWLGPPRSFGMYDTGDVVAIAMFTGIGAVLSALSEALHRLRRREERAREQREELLAIVAHDLRNPLNVISMSAALLEKDLARIGDGEASRRRIAALRRSAQQMQQLISDLLDWSAIDAGRLSVEMAPAGMEEVRSLVGDACDAHRDVAASRDIQIELDAPAGSDKILIDRARLLQVLSNLIGNAIKFTPPGGRIVARVERRDGMVRFCLSDTGAGIPEQDLPHIFERYWHKARAKGGGTGLGLYISKVIVQAHGGTLQVESKVGAGTTFFFSLPVVLPSDGRAESGPVA
jgi:signal transduction histidine kinase